MSDAGDLPAGLLESHRAWIAAVDGTDLAGYAEIVCEDVVWLPPGREPVRGRGAFRDWLAPFFEAYAYEFALDGVRFRVAGDRAVEKGAFRSLMTSRETGEEAEHAGRFIALWRRDDDGIWRIERYLDDTEPMTRRS